MGDEVDNVTLSILGIIGANAKDISRRGFMVG